MVRFNDHLVYWSTQMDLNITYSICKNIDMYFNYLNYN